MIAIEQLSHEGRGIPLGQVGEFRLRRDAPGPDPERVRVYVQSNGILHLTPLFEWSGWQQANQPFLFFPESPGAHSLQVCWVARDGSSGHAERPVQVQGPAAPTGGPQLADTPLAVKLWAPSPWEAQALQNYERRVLALLPEHVKPGAVVFDIGANLGLYSIACGRLAGTSGHVYAFEANPLCVYFLRANLSSAGIEWSDIVPVAIGDRSDWLEFTVNYDNLNLGVGGNSAHFGYKMGHRIRLAARDLDSLVEEFRLRAPDFIKMDIEGGEGAAVRGMSKTLRDHRPVLLMELHGQGAAGETLAMLDGHGYRYLNIQSGGRFTSGVDLVAQMPDEPIQVVALPS